MVERRPIILKNGIRHEIDAPDVIPDEVGGTGADTPASIFLSGGMRFDLGDIPQDTVASFTPGDNGEGGAFTGGFCLFVPKERDRGLLQGTNPVLGAWISGDATPEVVEIFNDVELPVVIGLLAILLTGTTGAPGAVTFSADSSGVVYVENRTNQTINYTAWFFATEA